jgi:hypothetical protein
MEASLLDDLWALSGGRESAGRAVDCLVLLLVLAEEEDGSSVACWVPKKCQLSTAVLALLAGGKLWAAGGTRHSWSGRDRSPCPIRSLGSRRCASTAHQDSP